MLKYDSYKIRRGQQRVSPRETKVMEILMDFGYSIDPQRYDGGDYDTAMEGIRNLLVVIDDEKI